MVTAVALAALACGPIQDRPSAAQVMNRMFLRMTDLESFRGTIRTTVTDGKGTLEIVTNVQSQSPSLLRLSQTQFVGGQPQRSAQIISDGELFAYTPPQRLLDSDPKLVNLVEPVSRGGVIATTGQIYQFGRVSFPNRPVLLDILFANTSDLETVIYQLATVTDLGDETYQGAPARRLGGDFRLPGEAATKGRWEMLVREEGVPLQFGYRLGLDGSFTLMTGIVSVENAGASSKVVLPANTAIQVVEVLELAENPAVDPALFKLPRRRVGGE